MSLRAEQTLEEFHMLDHTGSVAVGVSGGADSLALLHFLCALREQRSLKVLAVHLNHGLRGAEADRDEAHVRALCREWQVPLLTRRAEVAALAAASGESLEEAGRRARYAFFKEVAAREGAKIATAHTLNDSMETVLFHMARGTGLKGLCGIPPVRGNIIRPLIRDSRADVEAYCGEHGIEYVTDSSNLSRDYARNRLRMDVLPVLYGINPSFEESARRFLHNCSQDEVFLEEMAKLKLREAKTEGGYGAGLLRALPPPLLSRAVALAAARTGFEPEAVHIGELCALVRKGEGRLQLRGGWFACLRRGLLVFDPPAGAEEPFELPLRPGGLRAGGRTVTVRELANDEQTGNNFKIFVKQYFKSMVDCDKIIGNAVLRGRRPGDRLRPAGRGVSKTLKKLFSEEGVPPGKRDSLPCAADDLGVFWVCGAGPDERCSVTENTRRAYLILCSGGTGFER